MTIENNKKFNITFKIFKELILFLEKYNPKK